MPFQDAQRSLTPTQLTGMQVTEENYLRKPAKCSECIRGAKQSLSWELYVSWDPNLPGCSSEMDSHSGGGMSPWALEDGKTQHAVCSIWGPPLNCLIALGVPGVDGGGCRQRDPGWQGRRNPLSPCLDVKGQRHTSSHFTAWLIK